MKTTLLFLCLIILNANCLIAQDVKIGKQVWMSKNLDVDIFRNGDKILEAKSKQEWYNAGMSKQPVWCYFDFDPEKGKVFGKLYNWYAINDPRGLAPLGYHIPTDLEWTILTDFLDGTYKTSGTRLKSVDGWCPDYNNPKWNGGGNNSSGFNGLPGGYSDVFGGFMDPNCNGVWWSSTEYKDYRTDGEAWVRKLLSFKHETYRDRCGFLQGCSIRCLKD